MSSNAMSAWRPNGPAGKKDLRRVMPRIIMREAWRASFVVAVLFLANAADAVAGTTAVGARTGSSFGARARFGGTGAARHAGLEHGGYAGSLRRSGIGSQGNTGWYSRGFGGTLNPGWGYGFSPSLGGLSR